MSAKRITSLEDKEPLYLELYDALTHFIGRQQLVVRAVADQGVSPDDLQQGVGGWHEKTPQVGTWGGDWEIFFHGAGCRLKHHKTGEVVEWNAPDPYAFDPFFFVEHLEWRLAQGDWLPLLRAFCDEHGSDRIYGLINDLIADNIISSDYRLTPAPDETRASAA
jgi:hypothetical protein